MAIYGQDTFNRADNASSWGTASDGQVWSGGGTYTLAILSKQGTVTGQTTISNITLGSKNVGNVEAVLRFSVSATGAGAGLFLRGSLNNEYRIRYQAGSFFINKTLSGSTTTIASSTFTVTANTLYWIRTRIVDSAFFAKIWADGTVEPNAWTLGALGATTDTSFTSGGFGMYVKGNATTDVITFDNFYVFDYIWADELSAQDRFLATSDTTPGFVEALTISDIGGGSLQSWNVEALTISDSVAYAQTVLPVEALAISDSLLCTDSASFTDANTVNDSLIRQASYIPVDSLVASDTLLIQRTYNSTDALTILDSFLVQSVASFLDNYAASDSFTVSGIFTPIDTLQASDSFSSQKTYLPADNLIITDRLTGTSVYVPLDALVASDSLLATDGGTFLDGLSIADLLTVTITRILIFNGTVTWTTRDGKALTWKTRDGNASVWKTRDDKVTWLET